MSKRKRSERIGQAKKSHNSETVLFYNYKTKSSLSLPHLPDVSPPV